MAVPNVTFTEEGRIKVAKAVGLAHWICIIPAVLCFITALYIQLVVADKIFFIENYNGIILPGYLVFTGCFSLFGHILCGKAFWENHKPEKREKWAKFMFPAVIVTFLIFVFEMIAGISCLVHVGELEEALSSGISTAMKAYKNDMTTKEEMDVLQIEYECCGSRSYQDWFKVSWVHPDYLSGQSQHQKSHVSDDVPFSCCTPHVLRPCITHHVHDNDAHYNYDFRVKTTLYKHGCTDKLMEFYENTLLSNGGAIILGLSFIQLIIVVVGRLIQTATVTSIESDDETGDSVGYLFGAVKDQDTTTETGTTEELPSLETTFDSTEEVAPDSAELSYISREGLDFDSAEPIYENTKPSLELVEPIYHDEEVERYLENKYKQSKEHFEQLEGDDIPIMPVHQSSVRSGFYDEPLPYPSEEHVNRRGVTDISQSNSLQRDSSAHLRNGPQPKTHFVGRKLGSNKNDALRSQSIVMDTPNGFSDIPRPVPKQSHIDNSNIKVSEEYTDFIHSRNALANKNLRKIGFSKIDGLRSTKSNLRNYQSISDGTRSNSCQIPNIKQNTYARIPPRCSISSSRHDGRVGVPIKSGKYALSKNAKLCQSDAYKFSRQHDGNDKNMTEPLITKRKRSSEKGVGKAKVENLKTKYEQIFSNNNQEKLSKRDKHETQRRLNFADFRRKEMNLLNIKKACDQYENYKRVSDILENRNCAKKEEGNSAANRNANKCITENIHDTYVDSYKSYQTYECTPRLQSHSDRSRDSKVWSSPTEKVHNNATKEVEAHESENMLMDQLRHAEEYFDSSLRTTGDLYNDSFSSLAHEEPKKSPEHKHTKTRTHSLSPIYPVTSFGPVSPTKRDQTESNEFIINLVSHPTPQTSPVKKNEKDWS